MKVVVIGAGIIGATLAYALGQRGADVTVVDAAGPASGATGRSFGWINASFYADAAHFRLRSEGINAHRRLATALDLPIAWTGCLCWEEQGAALAAQAADLTALGYSARILERAEIAALEPHLNAPDQAVYFEAEAAAESAPLTQRLLMASNARLLTGCPVQSITSDDEKVTGVAVPGGHLPADRVVVAGGTGAPALLSPLAVTLPMLQRPGVMLRTKPLPPLLAHVCVAPTGEFRQDASGALIMPTAANHQGDTTQELGARPDVLAEAAMERLRDVLPDVDAELAEVSLAHRPVPQDGLPVVGACGPEGLFCAVMHSGITLAAVVADILSAQVCEAPLSNAQSDLIAPYRPDRFQSA